MRLGGRLALLSAPGALRGMAFMVAATLAATVTGIVVRLLASDMHPFEIAFFGSLFAIPLFVPFFIKGVAAVPRTRSLGLLGVRSLLYVVDILLLFTAFSLAPLAKVVAIDFSAPLFATLLAVLVLGEAPRASRVGALAVGFAGTLVVVRPGFGGLDLGTVAALVAALSAGVGIIVIKVLARSETSPTIALYTFLIGTPLLLLAALPFWKAPDGRELALLGVLGAFSGLIHLFNAEAFRSADLTAVLPLNFLRLIWMSVAAYAAFAEVPSAWTWLGGAMIFGAAMANALAERRTAAPPAAGR
jgi:drug/metabolite transporter (DMT)-like permease